MYSWIIWWDTKT